MLEVRDGREVFTTLLVRWGSRFEDKEMELKILERKWKFCYLKF